MNQNFFILCLALLLECIIVTSWEHKDRTEFSQLEEANPLDMGSYSHRARRNIHLESGRHGNDDAGEIEETVVTIAVHADRTDPTRHSQLESQSLAIDSIPQRKFGSIETLLESNEAGPYIHIMETSTKYRKQECVCPNLDESAVMVYIKRIVGSLLNQMGVQNHFFGPYETITIDLQGEISYESFMTLRKFIDSRDEDGGSLIQRVVEIMSGVLHTVHNFNYQPISNFEYMKEKISFHLPYLITPKFWLVLFSITLIGFVTLTLCYQMLRVRNYPLQFLLYVFLLFSVFSCIWIFFEMKEIDKAENEARLEQYDSVPKDCNYNNLTKLETIQYFIRVKFMGYEDQCIQYFKQKNVDPFFRIIPIVAVSDTVSRFFFHSLGYIGDKIGKFLSALTDAFPFWMRPLVLLFVFIFGFLGLFSYRIRTPYICIEPVPRSQILAPNEHTAVLENSAGQMVPLRRLDACTDTDDLEEFILRQIDPDAPVFEEHFTRFQRFHRFIASSFRWQPLQNFCNTSLQCFVAFSHTILLLVTKLLRDTPTLSNDSHDNDILKEMWDGHHDRMEIKSESPEPILNPSEAKVKTDPIEIQLQEAAVEETKYFPPTTYSSPAKARKRKRRSDSAVDSGVDEGSPLCVDDHTLELNDELLEGEIQS